MKFKRLSISIMIILLLLSGCGKKDPNDNKRSIVLMDYFDTVTSVVGFTDTEEEFEEICRFIESELERYDNLYDAYDPLTGLNNMYYVNKHAAEAPVKVEKDLLDLFILGKEIYTLTQGKTNFALGSVYAIWHEHRDDAAYDPASASIPTIEELQAAAKHSNLDDVVIDTENSTIFYKDPLLKCDVGAFAKGYAIERIAQSLLEKGVTNLTLNVGGNVRTLGPKPNNKAWSVAIQNPDLSSDNPYAETLYTYDTALATSGTYQRYFYVGDERYHHIINPDTLFPLNTFESVSILNKDAGLGDAYSTAVFNMTLEEGKKFIDALPDTEAMWILPDGSKIYSAGFMKGMIPEK